MSAMKRSIFRDSMLIALPAKSGAFVAVVGFWADQPLLLAVGLGVLLVTLLGFLGLWIANRRASRVDTDGEAEVFRYSALLTIGSPVSAWCAACFWSVLLLVPGDGLAAWGSRFLGIALFGISSFGAYHLTRACRSDLGEIRLSAEGIESRLRGGRRRLLPWSEVVELSAAPYHGVAGHGVEVVGPRDGIRIYENIRGIRVLKSRLLLAAREHGISDAKVCWDRFGILTEADRIGR
jgi:hypothetical protein